MTPLPRRPLPLTLLLLVIAFVYANITGTELMLIYADATLPYTPATLATYAVFALVWVALAGLWQLKSWGILLMGLLLVVWELAKAWMGHAPGLMTPALMAALVCVWLMRRFNPLIMSLVAVTLCVGGVSVGLAREPVWSLPRYPFADAGHALSQERLGYVYRAGLGIPKDASKAAHWYHRAAELGSHRAQWQLATLYRHGEGVAVNKALAFALARLASLGGNTDARKAEAEWAISLTEDELREAGRLMVGWVPRARVTIPGPSRNERIRP
jgi:hypothetical protein